MSTDKKTQIEIKLKLFEIAWLNFERQRAHEWKFAIIIWTALATFFAIIIQRKLDFTDFEKCFLIIIALVLIILIGLFKYRVQKSHRCNLEKAYLYEKELNEDAGVDFKGTEVEKAIKKVKGFGHRWAWSLVYVGIPVLLFISIFILFIFWY